MSPPFARGAPIRLSEFTDEQILAIVKKAEVVREVADLCRTHGITQQSHYRWKAKYGGMDSARCSG